MQLLTKMKLLKLTWFRLKLMLRKAYWGGNSGFLIKNWDFLKILKLLHVFLLLFMRAKMFLEKKKEIAHVIRGKLCVFC